MDASAKPHFRPTLIICVGKTGELVREHLSPYPFPVKDSGRKVERMAEGPVSVYHLLRGLDSHLHRSIGLLQVYTEGKTPYPDKAFPIPLARDFPDDPELPKVEDDLKQIIIATLRSVQLDSHIMDIKSQGYSVPDTRTQIFIVGEQDERNMPWVKKILGIIREEVPDVYHFDPPVCYFLNCNEVKGDYSAYLKKLPHSLKWFNYHLANFSYLFEPVIPYPTPTTLYPHQMQYATAEALFALAATGITTLSQFEEYMKLSTGIEDYSDHVGSFSSSMIQFPHGAVLRYCSALLSADMMQEWRRAFEDSDVSDEERYRLRNWAQGVVSDIREWMRDSEERPEAEGSFWPTLAILRRTNHPGSKNEMVMHRESLVRLRELTSNLFKCFSENEVTDVLKTLKAKSWTELASECSDKAIGLYPAWERQARLAWESASIRLDAEIRRNVDDFWEKDDNGFESARIFIDELDDRMVDLSNDTTRWRAEHDATYKNDREEFRQKSLGEWNLAENQSILLGDDKPAMQQLKPTLGGQSTSGALPGLSVIGGTGGGGSPSGGLGKVPQHLPPGEEDIALSLGRRVAFKQGLVPTAATLLGTSFLGCLTSVMMMTPFNLSTQLQLDVNSALIVIILVCNIIFRILRARDFQQAQRDTLKFYQRYYVHQCERREDLQRIILMRIVKGKVEKMRLRLDNLSRFFKSLEEQAHQEAGRVSEQLFDGPGGTRDILIANGERLRKAGPHTLLSVSHNVNNRRLRSPLAGYEWHRSLSTMKSQLIAQLRHGTESLLGMEEGEVQTTLYNFMAEVIDGYLTGSLVNISAALDNREIWDEVLERVEKPMYFTTVGSYRPEFIFVCGSRDDLVKGQKYIPAHVEQVRTGSSEWLMVGAFFRGGEPTKLNAPKLFPVK